MKTVVASIFSSLVSVYETLITACGISTGVAAYCGALLILTAIIARTIFDYGVVFAIDYTTYLVAFITFIGAVYVLRIRGHVSVSLVVTRLPKRVQEWLEVIQFVMALGYAVILLVHSIRMVATDFVTKAEAITMTATPIAYPELIMPIGLSLVVIELVVQLNKSVKRIKFRSKASTIS